MKTYENLWKPMKTYDWLVVSTYPSEKYEKHDFVSWDDDDSQLYGKINKSCSSHQQNEVSPQFGALECIASSKSAMLTTTLHQW